VTCEAKINEKTQNREGATLSKFIPREGGHRVEEKKRGGGREERHNIHGGTYQAREVGEGGSKEKNPSKTIREPILPEEKKKKGSLPMREEKTEGREENLEQHSCETIIRIRNPRRELLKGRFRNKKME